MGGKPMGVRHDVSEGAAAMSNKIIRLPLPTGPEYIMSRWLQGGSDIMHRISTIEWDNGEMIQGRGVALCGASGQWIMPGIFSRMCAPRCPKCCAALGIPKGNGISFNTLAGKMEDA